MRKTHGQSKTGVGTKFTMAALDSGDGNRGFVAEKKGMAGAMK
jgi:hypothetical protein